MVCFAPKDIIRKICMAPGSVACKLSRFYCSVLQKFDIHCHHPPFCGIGRIAGIKQIALVFVHMNFQVTCNVICSEWTHSCFTSRSAVGCWLVFCSFSVCMSELPFRVLNLYHHKSKYFTAWIFLAARKKKGIILMKKWPKSIQDTP